MGWKLSPLDRTYAFYILIFISMIETLKQAATYIVRIYTIMGYKYA